MEINENLFINLQSSTIILTFTKTLSEQLFLKRNGNQQKFIYKSSII